MSNTDAKFGPAPVPITVPDVRLAVIQFTLLTLITFLAAPCFVIPSRTTTPSVILSAITAMVVTMVTHTIVVRSNKDHIFQNT